MHFKQYPTQKKLIFMSKIKAINIINNIQINKVYVCWQKPTGCILNNIQVNKAYIYEKKNLARRILDNTQDKKSLYL